MPLPMVDQLSLGHVAFGTEMDLTFYPVIPTHGDGGLIAAGLPVSRAVETAMPFGRKR